MNKAAPGQEHTLSPICVPHTHTQERLHYEMVLFYVPEKLLLDSSC